MLKNLNIAIIVAAGSGSRLGSGTPKQFLRLGNREILSYSVETFSNHAKIDKVIIVTSADFLASVKKNYPNCSVVLGGSTRQESVAKGLKACPYRTRFVLVHDAARPLLPFDIIDSCLRQLDEFDGVAPAIEPVDSMVSIEGNRLKNLSRNNLRIVQTPQCFRVDVLKKAHTSPFVDTDEMGLVSKALPDARLSFVKGAQINMKITRDGDLEILNTYLKAQQK
ncbi:MAG: 2-C-methyl-D-erythritol 4-phosphate cytidylyltransferase [Candidatus Marinimicrobia bacterium]|nr:2-C-methyl-D-erythritol 4-phosphate cytidylyltransferase [Candidatus Neomarinimicrobiota bacterium]